MLEDYKKNDPRLWMFRNKYSKLIIYIIMVFVICLIIYEKFFK